jgi:hypothetical protein
MWALLERVQQMGLGLGCRKVEDVREACESPNAEDREHRFNCCRLQLIASSY